MDFKPVAWGLRKGKWADCFGFVFDLDQGASFADQLQKARAMANDRFPLPKALRLRHPWVFAIGCTAAPQEEQRRQADAFVPSWLGGEILQAVVVDLATRSLYAPPLFSRRDRTRAALYDNAPMVQAVLEFAPWRCPTCFADIAPPSYSGAWCETCGGEP